MRALLCALLGGAVALHAALAAQDGAANAAPAAPAARCVVGDRTLPDAAAEFDVFGRLVVAEDVAAGAATLLELTFPELEPPPPGEHRVAPDAPLRLRLGGVDGAGTLHVDRLDPLRARLRANVRTDGGPAIDVTVDLPVRATPAVVRDARAARDAPSSPPPPTAPAPAPDDTPRDAPADADLVFAVLGNTGTGSAVQRRIGASLAALAPSGPLDRVLLLGDLVLPRGTREVNDPAWLACFEEPYPERALRVPFDAVLGERDHRGLLEAYTKYAAAGTRLHLPHIAYAVEVQSHGRDVLLVGVDTTLYAHGATDPAMRFVHRFASTRLEQSKADLKIVFGHHSLLAHGPGGGASGAAESLRAVLLPVLERTGVDLYLGAGAYHQELLRHGSGLLEACVGTSGGLARSAERRDDTLFASTVPGFLWCRFDGSVLALSFRDDAGVPLHTHELRPRRPR